MSKYESGGDVPEQVTHPGSASKGYSTKEDGKIYPNENERTVKAYCVVQGSISFEHNQGAIREGFHPSEPEYKDMGQEHLQKLKATGSYAI
jgi:hypothetical protein